MHEAIIPLATVPPIYPLHEQMMARCANENGERDFIFGLNPNKNDLELIVRSPRLPLDLARPIPVFETGALCMFTARVALEESHNGTVVAVPLENAMAWLDRHGKFQGFAVKTAELATVWRLWKNNVGDEIRTQEGTFRGVLMVTDAERFNQVYVRGLGRKRTYGFGLIQATRIA